MKCETPIHFNTLGQFPECRLEDKISNLRFQDPCYPDQGCCRSWIYIHNIRLIRKNNIHTRITAASQDFCGFFCDINELIFPVTHIWHDAAFVRYFIAYFDQLPVNREEKLGFSSYYTCAQVL